MAGFGPAGPGSNEFLVGVDEQSNPLHPRILAGLPQFYSGGIMSKKKRKKTIEFRINLRAQNISELFLLFLLIVLLALIVIGHYEII